MPRAKHSPPTQAEREILTAFLNGDERKERNYTHILKPRLPGREDQWIRNHINMIKKRRKGLCYCGKRRSKVGTCQECKAKSRDYRLWLLGQGKCVSCSEPIDEGGSATMCSTCIKKRRADYGLYSKKLQARAKAHAKANPTPSKPKTYNLINWNAPRGANHVVSLIPKDALVVDLFGGSGDVGMRAAAAGRDLLAYNDIHPMLVAYIRVIQAGHGQELCRRVKSIRHLGSKNLPPMYTVSFREAQRWASSGPPEQLLYPPDPADRDAWGEHMGRAVMLYLTSRSVTERNMVKRQMQDELPNPAFGSGHLARMSEMAEHLEDVEVTCLDFAEAIAHHDCPQAVFLADPPWPGATGYEYNIEGRHEELVKALMEAQGRFLLTMQSSKRSMVAMKEIPYLYFRVSFHGAKLLMGSDMPLKGLEPINKAEFGYL